MKFRLEVKKSRDDLLCEDCYGGTKPEQIALSWFVFQNTRCNYYVILNHVHVNAGTLFCTTMSE